MDSNVPHPHNVDEEAKSNIIKLKYLKNNKN